MFFLGISVIISCQKDNEKNVPEDCFDKPIGEMVSLGEFDFNAQLFDSDSSCASCEKGYYVPVYQIPVLSSEIISTAKNVYSIPDYKFSPYVNYKWAYRHVKQPDGYSCSWTSYVICAGNIINAFAGSYPVTVSQVYSVKAGCAESKLITSLADYANTKDRNFVKARVIALNKSTTTDFDAIKQMMLLLFVNKTPFVTIAKSGSYNHYVIVYGIDWKCGLTGSKIYFTDPLDRDYYSFDANVKSLDLQSFISLMRTNTTSNFNFLEILSK